MKVLAIRPISSDEAARVAQFHHWILYTRSEDAQGSVCPTDPMTISATAEVIAAIHH
jgi:hypothetical protein